MILLDVRDYLKAAGSLAVRDVSLHFNISQHEAASMLQHWVKKGYARKLPSGSLCQGGCRSCDPNTIDLYEWSKGH